MTTIARDELRTLTDRFELEQLVGRLGRFIDQHRVEEAPELFADDVTVSTLGGTAEGIDAVVAQAGRNHTVTTQHLITNVLIELDGGAATIEANLLVVFADGAPAPVGPNRVELPTFGRALGERYRFEAVRSAAGWRLRRVEIAALWHAVAGAV